MDSNDNYINNKIIENIISTSRLGTINDTLKDITSYIDSTTSRATLKLIPDNIAKELHEAIALGGESVKRSLALWYADPNVLETMTALVDTCVAYIGEEVTAILRKYSNI